MRRIACSLFALMQIGCATSPAWQIARLDGSTERDSSGSVVGVDLSRGFYVPAAGIEGHWHVMGDSLPRKSRVEDANLTVLRGFAELESLNLTGTMVTGSGLAELAKPDALRKLNLSATKVSDDDLDFVVALHKVTELQLSGTPITDAGLQKLASLQELEVLAIDNTAITDEGLATLLQMSSLRTIYACETQISTAAIQAAQQQRPDLRIVVEKTGGVI
ncbi:MAG: hypothetical protein AB7O68_18910 [Pirellulales bacterium]